jgi:outer membrane protein OmpA-like peptidoglycan-associated protein
MKKIAMGMMVAAALALALPASALKFDDMSWWGNTGATPDPVQDKVRPGYWWWPTQPASNVNDQEVWGNRGVVYYHPWSPRVADAPPPPPPPPPPADPRVQRTTPVLNQVLFEFDKSVLRPGANGLDAVNELLTELRTYPNDTVVIEGHTCNIGSAEYNMGLGQRRANAVQTYLVDNGISANRVSTVSHGLTRPAVPNDTTANRALNRRAVFVYNVVQD